MTKDYKGRAQPKANKAPRRNCLFWFLSGLLLGAFAVGLLWLRLDPALIRSGKPLDGTSVPRPKVDQNQPPPASQLDEFGYEGILENLEVLVTAEEAPPPTPKPAPKPAPVETPKPRAAEPPVVAAKTQPEPPTLKTKPVSRDAWILQVGAFSKKEDAEKRRAQLAFLGVSSRVQRITINGEKTFHRVRSGPYSSQTELDKIRQKLTRNKIKTSVIRSSVSN